MKVLNSILSLMLIITLTNCSKDDNTDDGVGSGKITATIDGVKIDFNNIEGARALNKIAFSGQNGDKSISFLLDDDVDTGTYNYNDEDKAFVITYTESNGDSGLISMSGSLTITKHSGNHITGTFDVEFSNFGYDGSKKAKGSFDITYADAGSLAN